MSIAYLVPFFNLSYGVVREPEVFEVACFIMLIKGTCCFCKRGFWVRSMNREDVDLQIGMLVDDPKSLFCRIVVLDIENLIEINVWVEYWMIYASSTMSNWQRISFAITRVWSQPLVGLAEVGLVVSSKRNLIKRRTRSLRYTYLFDLQLLKTRLETLRNSLLGQIPVSRSGEQDLRINREPIFISSTSLTKNGLWQAPRISGSCVNPRDTEFFELHKKLLYLINFGKITDSECCATEYEFYWIHVWYDEHMRRKSVNL